MEVNRERLAASFTELCEIDSPSRREGRISRRLQELFRELGAAEIIEDDSARETGAECGNLIVRFDGGLDLSGGEWQKVALARAYLRDAQLLVLDEPTAALDARSEFEVFERFAELTDGRMALLISHRFSTVRMADRIVVLADGRIEEDGHHESLMARGARYARMFELQAASYR